MLVEEEYIFQFGLFFVELKLEPFGILAHQR